jgi:5-methylcytosine-specific restriction endonuclease McrA
MRNHNAMRNSSKQRLRRNVVKAGERFTKLDVVQTHGSTCYLCGDEVLFDRSQPRRLWPSLDHVVPIFHGGSHTMSNCRVVHYACNARKGARLLVEVA